MEIDHLVYAGPDLDLAAEKVAALLGVSPVPGGRHVGLGTHNCLVDLGGGAYLEVIGPDLEQPDPPEPRPFGIDSLAAPRLVAWAVRSTSIVEEVDQMRAEGLDLGPVISMERARPDGAELRWRLTAPRPGLVPFVIDWGDTPHPTTTLPPGARLSELRIESPAAGVVAGRLRAMGIGVPVTMGTAERIVAVIEVDGRAVDLA